MKRRKFLSLIPSFFTTTLFTKPSCAYESSHSIIHIKNYGALRKYLSSKEVKSGHIIYVQIPPGPHFIVNKKNKLIQDNGGTIITSSGGNYYAERIFNGPLYLSWFEGIDPTAQKDSSKALNVVFSLGKEVVDDEAGNYKISSTVRLKSSFYGTSRVFDGEKEKVTIFIKEKDSDALLVHYPARRIYKNYVVNANGNKTGIDCFCADTTYGGGLKYSYMENVVVREAKERAFNFNQPLFGFTGINLRVAANSESGISDNVIAFYTTIEKAEGISQKIGNTNAAWTLITPNVYNRSKSKNSVTFWQAEYQRGVKIIGAEVAAARICNLVQVDATISGAFEFISEYSTLYRCVIEIAGGTNLQTTRLSAKDWGKKTNIPNKKSPGRHIFLVDAETDLTITSISFFNQLGTLKNKNTGVVSLVACKKSFLGKVSVGKVNNYDLAKAGKAPPIEVEFNNPQVSVQTSYGLDSFIRFNEVISFNDSNKKKIFPKAKEIDKYFIEKDILIREIIIQSDLDNLDKMIYLTIETTHSKGADKIDNIYIDRVDDSVFFSDDLNLFINKGSYLKITVIKKSNIPPTLINLIGKIRINS